MPRVIGLTGGIASGKSTVAALFRERGAEVIDADQVARDVVLPGQPALAEIAAHFGPAVLTPDGGLDRKHLGALVFSDAEKRRALNRIIHPRIGAETARLIHAAGERGLEVVLYEAALLVENGIHHGLDGLIVVSAPAEAQLARAAARDALTVEEIRGRLAAQAPLEEKIAAADYVIDNAGTPEKLCAQVDSVWKDIQSGGPKRRAPGR